MNILVTRPKGKGEKLVTQLNSLVASAHYQPVLEIKSCNDSGLLPAALIQQPPNFLIFVSGFAVDHFISLVKDPLLLESSGATVIAVGDATAQRLRQWANIVVVTPTIETSEGLLTLPQLQKSAVVGKRIVIVRGEGGRDLMAQRLRRYSAIVDFWQLYQRIAIEGQGEYWFKQWQQWQIDCIVVTSVAIFEALFEQLPQSAECWLRSRQWLVASSRIADAAAAMGIEEVRIHDAQGASDNAILAQVQRLIEKSDDSKKYIPTTR